MLTQFLKGLKIATAILMVLFLYVIMTHSCGCRSEEEKYFQLKYPECVVEIGEKTNISTEVIVHCPGREPKIIKVRSK